MSIGILPDTAFVQPSGINVASWTFVAPEHWQRKRLKFLCDVNPARSTNLRNGIPDIVSFLPMELANENRPDFQAVDRPFTEVSNGFTSFANGDVLTAKITPCFENGKGGICRSLTNGIGFGSTEFHVFRPYNEISNKYLYYVMHSRPFRETGASQMKGSAGQQRVPTDFFSEFVLPYPPRVEQDVIVGYLDAKLEQIDRFITNKRHLIELLEEERQTSTDRIVRGELTKGDTKPSHIPGLGDIPSSWSIRRLRYLATKFGSGVTPRGGATVYQDTGIPFLRSQNIHFDGLRLAGVAYISQEIHDNMRGSSVHPNDVLLNITGASIGRTCAVPNDFLEANVSQHVCIIRTRNKILDSAYLTSILSTQFIQNEILIEQNGASREGLNLRSIKAFPIPLPPLNVQKELVKQIDQQQIKITKVIKEATNSIDLINEFCTSLIAEAVTGKIDLRSK